MNPVAERTVLPGCMWKNVDLENKGAIAWIANVIFTDPVSMSIITITSRWIVNELLFATAVEYF